MAEKITNTCYRCGKAIDRASALPICESCLTGDRLIKGIEESADQMLTWTPAELALAKEAVATVQAACRALEDGDRPKALRLYKSLKKKVHSTRNR
jgi:hypothetical protein